MGLKDKVKFNMLVDPDDPQTLILMPVDGEIKDGSVYTINIKDLQFTDGSVSSHKETFITTPTENFFCSVQDVQELIRGAGVSNDDLDINNSIFLFKILKNNQLITWYNYKRLG